MTNWAAIQIQFKIVFYLFYTFQPMGYTKKNTVPAVSVECGITQQSKSLHTPIPNFLFISLGISKQFRQCNSDKVCNAIL